MRAPEVARVRLGQRLAGEPASSAGTALPTWLRRTDRYLGWLSEGPAAVLVLAEVVILFAGMTSRYVFDAPLVWTDELAGILFLWLSMLGMVIALRRGAHMRMTAFIARLSPNASLRLDAFATVLSLLLLALLLPSSYDYAQAQAVIVTPAMQISDAWRASALPVGIVLGLLAGLLRLCRVGHRIAAGATLMVLALGAAFWWAGPWLEPLGQLNLLIFFVGVVGVCVVLGVPIAFAFAVASFGYLTLTTATPMVVMVGRLDSGMSPLILLAVPLFVLLGLLIEMTGMARAMVQFLASLLGNVRGGLQYVLIAAMYLVSGISGSKTADMAAIAPALFPEMQARGAKPGDLVALLSTTGAQTETLPPSIVLITIGSVTGVSISALFAAGMMPGLVLGLALCLVVWWRQRHAPLAAAAPRSLRQIGRGFVLALPALVLPFVIRISVVEGVATATEVSTLGIVYTVLVGLLIHRRCDWRRLPGILVETAALSGAILFIIGAATAMAWALTQSGFAQELASVMTQLPGGRYGFIVVSILAFIVLGSVLEGIPAMVLFGPLTFPIANTLGINEVHYAMIVILSMGLGLFAPPFGVGYYGACAVGKVDPALGMRPIWGYLAALIVGLVLVAAIPWISTGFFPR